MRLTGTTLKEGLVDDGNDTGGYLRFVLVPQEALAAKVRFPSAFGTFVPKLKGSQMRCTSSL
jgi:hypothetical protein